MHQQESSSPPLTSQAFRPSGMGGLTVCSGGGEILRSVCEAMENCTGEGILLLLNEL